MLVPLVVLHDGGSERQQQVEEHEEDLGDGVRQEVESSLFCLSHEECRTVALKLPPSKISTS